MLRLYTFGGLRIELQGRSLQQLPRSARRLLVFLILHHDQTISRDFLAGAFWPDRPDVRARRALSQAVWQIRAALGEGAARLVVESENLVFSLLPGDWLDVANFEMLAGEARPSVGVLEGAVSLYQADFLAGWYDDWALVERERLRELHLRSLERLTLLYKQAGEYEKALVSARRLCTDDPLRESSHREVMRLLHLLGRGVAALQQYQILSEILSEELGVAPFQETVLLAHQIAAEMGETSLPYLPPVRPAAAENPEHLPLVGRAEARTKLLSYLEAAANGCGGTVLVEGEAGVGKTRLLQELAGDAEWRGVVTGWGWGEDLAALPPYGLWQGVMGSVLSPLRVSQLVALVDSVWIQEAARVLPGLMDVLPTGGGHLGLEQLRERLLEGLTQITRSLGTISAHLLILDDLQWADHATLDFLQHMAARLSDSRVLVVGSFRSEEARDRQEVWDLLKALDQAAGQRRVLLDRLTWDQTEELVAHGLGPAARSSGLSERVYRETDGNPLFIVETIRALGDDAGGGGLAGCGAPGEQPSVASSLPLPAGVRRVIDRRLACLSAVEEGVLRAAAVLGSDVRAALLVQVAELDAPSCLAVAKDLLRRGLLTETTSAYRFSHDKIREVVYAGLEAAHRRELHARAGYALQAMQPERVEPMARHFLRGEVWDRAAVHSLAAGRRAWEVYAGSEAFEYLSRGIEAWQRINPVDAALGADLYAERGRLCQETGRFQQAEADLRMALQLAEQMQDLAAQARSLNPLSYLYFQRGEYEKAAEAAQQGLAAAAVAGLESEMAASLFCQANAARQLGHLETAIGLYERAAAMFEPLGDQVRFADCLNRLAGALTFSGAYRQAEAMMENALEIRRRLDDRIGMSYSLINLTGLYTCMGQFERAEAAGREALALAVEVGDPYGEDGALHNLGEAYVRQGRPEQALPLLTAALEIARRIGDRATEAETLGQLGMAFMLLGDVEQAQRLSEEALGLLGASMEAYATALVRANLAQVSLAQGHLQAAETHALASLTGSEGGSLPFPLGMAQRTLGLLRAQQGSDAAEEHLTESVRIFAEIGAEAELARSRAALGAHLCQVGDADSCERGRALLEEAHQVSERLHMLLDSQPLAAAASARSRPGQVRVRLAGTDAPTGRPLRTDDMVSVVWTPRSVRDAAIHGKVARRRHRLRRLLRQASEQGGAPTVLDLAEALGVGARSIERDLAALRSAGDDPKTRGWRKIG